MSASSWAGAVSSPGSPLESPTRPRGALEQSSSSASSARSPPARCARRSIRRRATPSEGARGHPGSWRSRSSIPFDGASTRREPVRVLERRQTRARAGASTGAQRRGQRAATTSAGSLAARRRSKASQKLPFVHLRAPCLEFFIPTAWCSGVRTRLHLLGGGWSYAFRSSREGAGAQRACVVICCLYLPNRGQRQAHCLPAHGSRPRVPRHARGQAGILQDRRGPASSSPASRAGRA